MNEYINLSVDNINEEHICCAIGDPKALHSFNGEYMSQYSNWSYTMELNLQKYFYEE